MSITVKKIGRKLISNFGRHRWPGFTSNLLVLAYHRVLPISDERFLKEQPGMRVSPETFEKNMKWVREHFQFISLKEWLELVKVGSAPRGKYCAVTFDDGWIDNYQYAFPILERLRIPATIFCVANMIDSCEDYWPQRLTSLVAATDFDAIKGTSLDENIVWLLKACANESINWQNPRQEDFHRIIEAVKVYTDEELRQLIHQTKVALSLEYVEERQVLNSMELEEMLKSGLIEIGSHTTNHIRLSDATNADILKREIVDSRDLISAKLKCSVDLFCYPNGFHPKSAELLVADNYLGGCILERGWNKSSDDFFALKRVNLHEDVASERDSFGAMLAAWH